MAGALTAAALAAPATAWSAAIALTPAKTCYRSGENVTLQGAGFTPNNSAAVALDGKRLGFASSDPKGSIRGKVTLGRIVGERNRVITATDQANPANTATLTLHASGVAVSVKPRRAGPGRRVRIKAYGFTGSRRLYAHVRRGRFRRTVALGRLKGPCRKLSRRVRVFSRSTKPGVYVVQFDGKRRYSSRTVPAIRYRVTIFPRVVGRGFASVADRSWAPVG